jgi:hypothetical protein
MGEVYQLDNAIHHGVAEGYEGVDAPSGQPSEKKLKEIFHVKQLGLLGIIVNVVLTIVSRSGGVEKKGTGLSACPLKNLLYRLPSLREFQLSARVGGFLGRPDWSIARRTPMDSSC